MARAKGFKPTRFMLPTSHYDKARADHAVAFIQSLKHTKGVWAGQPFLLFDWQEQIIRDLYGVVKPNGYRQFNAAFVEICKKAGKSELAAAVALYMLCADEEEGGEIYGCANDRAQASIVFDVAKDMVLQSPALLKRIKIVESQKRLVYLPTRSIYQALSSEVASKYGYNVHACIFDELLGQPNRKLFDVMTKGSGAARKQPLNFVITTAGSDKNSICYEVHSKAADNLEGRKHDSTFYPVVYSAPTEADWTDPKVWKSVNPSLGKTVDPEFYRAACESAKQNPAEEMQFRQFFLCQWTSSTVRWMPMDKWDACAFPVDPERLRGRVCYGGLDLSSTTDITAFVLVFPPEDDEGKYEILPLFWLPEDNVDLRVRRDHVPYDIWAKQGHVFTTEGNVVHYGFIEEFIEELGTKYNIQEIAFDRWGAVQMTQNLEGLGFTVVPFGQGFKDMSPPTKELMKLTLEQRLAHGGHPVLRWMVDNVTIRSDPAGNIKADKEKSTEKIDGAIATIMALDRAIRHGGATGSVYDERGLLFYMSAFGRLFRSRDKPKNNLNGSGYSFLFGSTSSGKAVNERSAMQMSAVYACVRILSEAVASLPLHMYRYNDTGGKEKALTHPLYGILHDEPNPEMSAFSFRETLMSHLLLWGNGFAQIIRNGRGEVVALYPLTPDRMAVDRDSRGRLYYEYTRSDGDARTLGGKSTVTLSPSDVLHIPGLGFDGLVGYSPIAMAKQAIGMGLACDEYGASFYQNGAQPGGVLEHPGVVKDPKRVRESWNAIYQGSANAHRVAVLEEGMSYKPISISPEQAQFLQTRKFQIEEIARIFRVPPHMVGDLDKSSFSNIEQQSLEFVKYSLSPWITRWEQSIHRALLLPSEKQRFFVRFNVEGLLRGDYKSRMDGYAVARQNGWMNANDIRELENLDRIPAEDGGDLYLINGNMTKLADAGLFAANQRKKEDTGH